MEVVSKEEFLISKEKFIDMVKDGAIFIHPTDTIYGIGCIATKGKTVRRVRDVKKRDIMPFSIIISNIDWIYSNCIVPPFAEEWIKKLPGPYTLIFKLKNREAIANEVNNSWETIGVRIPKHWFSDFVRELGSPVITTSANISGEEFMTSMENLNPEIKAKMDFIIYEGEKEGFPSTIVNLSKAEVEVVSRGRSQPSPERRPISNLIRKIVKK
ncbi:MAG: L-threonylcarbamoyladenylate synthase [Candidatus Woesearchaeota archaeon]|nr:L-threonylcarbamoyladenylate synthase [Candidatus Woesearchaeota archaeon]